MKNITLFDFKQKQSFVETDEIKDIIERAIVYLNIGYPIHLKGPAGTGKTTLAMHLAHILNQPAVVIFGSDEVRSVDMVGGQFGYRKKVVIDNYIHSVLKTDETAEQQWIDGRLVTACKEGYILIYDEFTRSTPETNNILLSVLEEKVLELPINGSSSNHIKVNPNFKAIFTSNPEKYAGVYDTQEALLDRMITINLKHWDKETEREITAAQSGISKDEAEKIVNIVRSYRDNSGSNVSIRSAIMMGKVINELNIDISPNNETFIKICEDILGGRGNLDKKTSKSKKAVVSVKEVISNVNSE